MPRTPKWRITHPQAGGQEIFFARRGSRWPTRMVGAGPMWKGKLIEKRKYGTWTLPRSLRIGKVK